jgi:hypothetical protein
MIKAQGGIFGWVSASKAGSRRARLDRAAAFFSQQLRPTADKIGSWCSLRKTRPRMLRQRPDRSSICGKVVGRRNLATFWHSSCATLA